MKFSRRVDGSVCSTVLSNYPPATGLKFRAPKGSRAVCTSKVKTATKHLGGGFFCPKSSHWLYSTFVTPDATHPQRRNVSQQYSTAAAVAPKPESPLEPPQKSKEELHAYVRPDPEDEDSADEHFRYYRDPYRRGYAQPAGQEVEVSENHHDVKYPTKDEVWSGGDETQKLVQQLYSAIRTRSRHPHRIRLESIHKLYRKLPEPRMLNLVGPARHRLLRIMGLPHKRSLDAMLRYFSLVSDVKSAGLTLRRVQWNYALAFAAKYTSHVGTQELEAVLKMWRDMEVGAGEKANHVTFNILFDTACKAGNSELAELLYNEMEHRGIPFNRYHHVSLIHFFGLRLDSGGIRAAYREMVESNEIVDQIALNCVIQGFLRCGEETAAEDVYQRMKDNNVSPHLFVPSTNYAANKVVNKVLLMFTKIGKQHPELKSTLEKGVNLAPGLRTYRHFIEHYGIKVGNLNKVAEFLNEMRATRIPVDATIFLALFKSFYVHGGYSGSAWSRTRLDRILQAMYDTRDENAKGFKIDTWLVIWALRAVKKVGTAEDLELCFQRLQQRWDVHHDRVRHLHQIHDVIMKGRDMRVQDPYANGTMLRNRRMSGF